MTSNNVQRIPHLLSRLVAAMLFLLAGQLLAFAVAAPPTITSFSPTKGPVGTVVTITGTNFTDLVDVEFNVQLTSYTVVNSTTLKVIIPPDAGTGNFYVITANGTVLSDGIFIVSTVSSVNDKDNADMVWVPAGLFTRGTIPGFGMIAEHPQSQITLDGYWIYKYEVTVAQYRAFCTATNRAMPTAPQWGLVDTNPIGNVTWNDAQAYADWAGVKLPTEAQWEKAARGIDKRNYPWGGITNPNDQVGYWAGWDATKCANHDNSEGNGHFGFWPVGSFPTGVSPYGAMDMSGNASEWVADWMSTGGYSATPTVNPTGPPTGTSRVIRGGSYTSAPNNLRCSTRGWEVPTSTYWDIGFRCVSNAQAPPVVISFSPTSGVVGTVVTIKGTGFTGATTVLVGQSIASSFSVVNDTTITVTIPQGCLGGPVAVYTPFGNASGSILFTVIPPLSLAITPVSPTAVGVQMKITATPAHPTTLEYQFRVKYAGAGGVFVWETIQDYSAKNTCIWKPLVPRQYTVFAYARIPGTTVKYAVYREQTVTVNAAATGLKFYANPASPTAVGMPVKLSVTPIGGGTMEYRFRVKYLSNNAPIYVWTTIQEYSPLSTCTWISDFATDYILYVYGREKGSKNTYDLFKEMPYSVKQPVSNVVFSTSIAAPTGVGTPIKLIATPTGGGTLEYKFYATYMDSSDITHVELIQDFSTKNTVTWTPTVAATYNPLTVVVREKGKTGEFDFDIMREIFGYEVVPAVSSLKLYTIPENFIPVGFAVDIIAEATGGGNLEFQFKAKYLSGTSYVWQTLQAYGPESLCAWSPTEAHSYIIVAYAREFGTTIPYKVYRELAFTVTP